MKTWTYRWSETKHPRRTGMIWRGGILSYRWPITPQTRFSHIMCKLLSQQFFAQRDTILQLGVVKSLPRSSGKTIQFFTYQKDAPE